MPPMAEAAAQVTDLWQLGGALLGIGWVGGCNVWAFVKLRTEVKLYREENQKDHGVVFKKLDDLNGKGSDNTNEIAAINARCKEREKHQ